MYWPFALLENETTKERAARVSKILGGDNGLHGTLPSELAQLTSLKSLVVSNSRISVYHDDSPIFNLTGIENLQTGGLGTEQGKRLEDVLSRLSKLSSLLPLRSQACG